MTTKIARVAYSIPELTEVRFCAFGPGLPAETLAGAIAKCVTSIEDQIPVGDLTDTFTLRVSVKDENEKF